MEPINITIAPEITGTVSIGILQFTGLRCYPKDDKLWEQIRLLEEKLRGAYASPSDALDKLRPARNLYRAIGMEPTRTRPSSEALFRRVIKQKPLYQINSIVDVCNFCSLAFFLPIGLYDRRKIQGDVMLRKGEAAEEYQGIRKDMIHVGGRFTLADRQGPFGNPSSDSLRTAITGDSRDVLMVIFGPFDYPQDKMQLHLLFAAKAMEHSHPGGETSQISVLK